MPGRKFTAGTQYRYGFNGQEKSDELKGEGNSYTAEFWEYDPRVGRRWNLDPKPIMGVSLYSTFSNNPIAYSDPLGDTTVTGAGGNYRVDVDEKSTSLQFYKSSVRYSANGKAVPIQAGQLRSVSNNFGTFKAKWNLNPKGNNVFAGYLNDKNQTLEAAAEEINNFANSFVGKYFLWAAGQAEDAQRDPVGHNLKLSLTLVTISAMAAVEPVGYSFGNNPSLTTQESMSGIGFIRAAPKYTEGSFSIFNWQGYPSWGVKPTGIFRLLEGTEYITARSLANKTNAEIHKAAPYLKSLQIHEINPVKFGGSPTDAANKIFLSPAQHAEYTNFWNSLMREIKK